MPGGYLWRNLKHQEFTEKLVTRKLLGEIPTGSGMSETFGTLSVTLSFRKTHLWGTN